MIAFGGNALSPRGEAGTITQQFAKTRESLASMMHFVENNYKLCITHGNGPQVGDELLRMDLTHDKVPPIPLGVCVAGTQGTIGYMIQQSLQNILNKNNIDRAYINYNKPNQEKIGNITSIQAQKYLDSGHFQSGSMKPKIEAGNYFLRHHGKKVVITSIPNIKNAIGGKSGTIIRK